MCQFVITQILQNLYSDPKRNTRLSPEEVKESGRMLLIIKNLTPEALKPLMGHYETMGMEIQWLQTGFRRHCLDFLDDLVKQTPTGTNPTKE